MENEKETCSCQLICVAVANGTIDLKCWLPFEKHLLLWVMLPYSAASSESPECRKVKNSNNKINKLIFKKAERRTEQQSVNRTEIPKQEKEECGYKS